MPRDAPSTTPSPALSSSALSSPPDAAGHDEVGLSAYGGDRMVTAIATSVAVLIVAAVAVLMGMA